jgi:D-alanine-D-alanine ligase
MYPKAMEASGIGYAELVDRLIAHALARSRSGQASPKGATP